MKTILNTLLILMIGIFVYADPGLSTYKLNGNRLFSIGDIHGDVRALTAAFASVGLISAETYTWTGGNSHVVLTGDLVDRGPDTRFVMDFIMGLSRQAAAQGGQIHALLGNHEMLVSAGILRYAHPNDLRAFDEFKASDTNTGREAFINAFKNDSPYAQWFRDRNAIVKINDTLFVHAGVERWALFHSIDEINQMVNSWLKYFQKVGKKPPESTRWVIEDEGPLWTRKFVAYPEFNFEFDPEDMITPLKEADLNKILKAYEVQRIVVGHSIVTDFKKSVNHPAFGSKVIMGDSGMSVAYGKKVSIFEHLPDGTVIAHHVARGRPEILKSYRSAPALATSCSAVYR